MAGLLVSVRSVDEARAAVLGGAAVVDIKEPRLGPLGRSTPATWRAIRGEVPIQVPVSVALGELIDLDPGGDSIPPEALAGIAFRKAGPAHLGTSWADRWQAACRASPAGAGWVAVIYADWERAGGPEPDAVIAAALATSNCPGVLVDSWDKAAGCPIVDIARWRDRVEQVQASGRFVALAGRLQRADFHRLAPLHSDLLAVRGAACAGGRREGTIDVDLVADLVRLAGSIPSGRSSRPAWRSPGRAR